MDFWVLDELSFNKSFDHYEDIAQLMLERQNYGQEVETTTSLPPGLGTYFRENYGNQFEEVVIMRSRPEESILTIDEDSFTETGYFMQKGGPEMFSLDMVGGSRAGLSGMNSIFLSQQLAHKLFGNKDPIWPKSAPKKSEYVKYSVPRYIFYGKCSRKTL